MAQSRPIRDKDPNRLQHIVIRTFGEEFLLKPTAELNELIGGIIARYQEMHEITLFAGKAMSNHVHTFAQAPRGNLADFERDVNRETALRVNRYLERRGSLWGSRYKAEPVVRNAEPLEEFPLEKWQTEGILSDDDALDAFLYVTCNNVHHGAERHPTRWPGFCTYRQSLSGKEKKYRFFHYTEYHQALNRAKRLRSREELPRKQDYYSEHTLNISPLPLLKDLSQEDRKEFIKYHTAKRSEEYIAKRAAKGLGIMTRKEILEMPRRGVIPKNPSRKQRSRGRCTDPEAKKIFHQKRKGIEAKYKRSSARFRGGDLNVWFPEHTYRPPLHIIPKLVPIVFFQPQVAAQAP